MRIVFVYFEQSAFDYLERITNKFVFGNFSTESSKIASPPSCFQCWIVDLDLDLSRLSQ